MAFGNHLSIPLPLLYLIESRTMYVPAHFLETQPEELRRVITENPLGIFITNGESGLDANHIPFEYVKSDNGPDVLRAHVARANPVWQDVSSGAEVLVVFRAEEAYVSPSWYPSKHEFHKQVPTWNYKVVHARGNVKIIDDERYVRGVVARLTRTHEADQPKPWKMADAPKDWLDSRLGVIVGIEIEITELIGKFKLSQNREARDRKGAGDMLIANGDDKLGCAMINTISEEK